MQTNKNPGLMNNASSKLEDTDGVGCMAWSASIRSYLGIGILDRDNVPRVHHRGRLCLKREGMLRSSWGNVTSEGSMDIFL